MKTRNLVLLFMIVLAATSRLLPHPPNVAPITAMAVFGALTFRNRWYALVVPLVSLLISDFGIEVLYRYGLSENWGIYKGMWVTYAATLLIAWLAYSNRGPVSFTRTTLTTLMGSIVFFVTTNFAVWAGGSMYAHTLQGLGECYVLAIPFFRNSLLGDAVYGLALFGGFALVEAKYKLYQPA